MNVGGRRQLVVIADDYGIGPRTSAGILELAQQGLVTGSVLLVNSPYAETEVANWDAAGRPMELGWHPNLTLDAPVLPARRVLSLVNAKGRFWPLGTFMKRLFFSRINTVEVACRVPSRSLKRFVSTWWAGLPRLLNSHQHVSHLRSHRPNPARESMRQSGERSHESQLRKEQPWPLHLANTRCPEKARVFECPWSGSGEPAARGSRLSRQRNGWAASLTPPG